MGLRAFLAGLFHSPGAGPVGRCPSDEYPTPRPLIETAISKLMTSGLAEGGWANFETDGERGEIVIQATTEYVNTCNEWVDIAALLRAAGEHELAGRTSPTRKGIVEIRDATARDLAIAVDAVFRAHYQLPAGYALRASLEI